MSSKAQKAVTGEVPELTAEALAARAALEQAEAEATAPPATVALTVATAEEAAATAISNAKLALTKAESVVLAAGEKATHHQKWAVTQATQKVYWADPRFREFVAQAAADVKAVIMANAAAGLTIPGVKPAHVYYAPADALYDADGNPIDWLALGIQPPQRRVVVEASNDFSGIARFITRVLVGKPACG